MLGDRPSGDAGNAVSHTTSPPEHATSASPGATPERAGTTVITDLVARPWTRAIQQVVGDRNVSVSVGVGHRIIFELAGTTPRLPASNEKLLTSMAVLAAFGPGHRFPTLARASGRPRGGVLPGDLWLVGSGDPELTGAGLATLASRLAAGGLREIRGSVLVTRARSIADGGPPAGSPASRASS